MSILTNPALGFFLGFPLGFFVAAWVIQLVRCEDCCQKDEKVEDEIEYLRRAKK